MGRRRDADDGVFTFEIVPGDGHDPRRSAPEAADLPDGGAAVVHLERVEPDPEPEAGPARGPRTPHAQRWLVAVLVLVLGAVGAVAIDVVGDRNRAAALRVASGGVLDLSRPPAVTWDVRADDRAPGGLVAVMGGAAVIQRYDDLEGVDLDTGERRWSVRLPDRTSECGGGYGLWDQRARIVPSRLLVCLSGRAEERTVVVVDAEGGVVSRRPLEVADDLVRPAPHGAVVTASWVGQASEPDVGLTGDPAAGDVQVDGEIADGYDAEVRLLDAVTGEVRWERMVEFEPVLDGYRCVEYTNGGRDAEVDLRGELRVASAGDLLWVFGCGIDAWFTPAGERLEVVAGVGPSSHGAAVRALDGGGYVGSATGGRVGSVPEGDRLLGRDGQVRRELGGHLLVPRASDGGRGGVHLVRVGDETHAVDDEGRVLWVRGTRVVALLAQAGGIAVVTDALGRVAGLDLDTGREIWSHDDLLADVEGERVWGSVSDRVQSVFTDGRRMALVWPALDQEQIAAHWAAVDVATGELVWTSMLEHDAWGIDLAADGRLLRWSPTAIVGLG
ncbi:PQQ-binding-like beta-propeller repeat protein [Isoptericola variabilis]|uniref:Pyrrolo-quinoline quinone repeat-containing protein n=1 Tax=Isoptericola variabilis (strain 225) TaxID=743718 RepID=F6FW63_ISOV2|nr:PQQ-binding-like beta-propeller repeat protein [Isoptericola variabilis]AEG45607.1 Pyrrolo-quinoline quinone repeat-containing protein [Isoptericola variabilis 225]TWH25785.1 putative pyrroloquinoline-quinone binding quinoprotein [Isoptericola variabilis J7]